MKYTVETFTLPLGTWDVIHVSSIGRKFAERVAVKASRCSVNVRLRANDSVIAQFKKGKKV